MQSTPPSPELITEVVAEPFDKLTQNRAEMSGVPFFGDILSISNDSGICWAIAMSEAVGSLEHRHSINILSSIGAFVKGIKIPVDENDAEQFFVDFPAFRAMQRCEVKYLIGNDGGLSRRLSNREPEGMANIINYVLQGIDVDLSISIPKIEGALDPIKEINNRFSSTSLPVLSLNYEDFDQEDKFVVGSGHVVFISGIRRDQLGGLTGIQISDPSRDHVYWLDEKSFGLIKSGKPITYGLQNGNTHKISISPKNPIIWLTKKS